MYKQSLNERMSHLQSYWYIACNKQMNRTEIRRMCPLLFDLVSNLGSPSMRKFMNMKNKKYDENGEKKIQTHIRNLYSYLF